MNAIILITTYPNNPRNLKRFINEILYKGLAKCINRINYVKSYYIFEGKINKDEEKILIIKSTVDKKNKLEEFIKSKHPYKIPEIIYIKADELEEKYLNWLNLEEKIIKNNKSKQS